MSVAGGEISRTHPTLSLREQEKVHVLTSSGPSSREREQLRLKISSSHPTCTVTDAQTRIPTFTYILTSEYSNQLLDERDREIFNLKMTLHFMQERLDRLTPESKDKVFQDHLELKVAYVDLKDQARKNKKYALDTREAIEALQAENEELRRRVGNAKGGGDRERGRELELTEKVREEREKRTVEKEERKKAEERAERAERDLRELKEAQSRIKDEASEAEVCTNIPLWLLFQSLT